MCIIPGHLDFLLGLLGDTITVRCCASILKLGHESSLLLKGKQRVDAFTIIDLESWEAARL